MHGWRGGGAPRWQGGRRLRRQGGRGSRRLVCLEDQPRRHAVRHDGVYDIFESGGRRTVSARADAVVLGATQLSYQLGDAGGHGTIGDRLRRRSGHVLGEIARMPSSMPGIHRKRERLGKELACESVLLEQGPVVLGQASRDIGHVVRELEQRAVRLVGAFEMVA